MPPTTQYPDALILDTAESLGIPHDQPIAAWQIAKALGISLRYAGRRIERLRGQGAWPWPVPSTSTSKHLKPQKETPVREPKLPTESERREWLRRKAIVDEVRRAIYEDPAADGYDITGYHRRLDEALGDTIGCTPEFLRSRRQHA